jgi:predicted transcriptional regulator
MSNRELAMALVQKLPANAPPAEIAREIELLAGIRTARQQARRGEGLPVQEVRKLVDSWAVPSCKWTLRNRR